MEGIPPSCIKEVTRKAKVTHKCCECHKEIKIGEHYVYISGIWDGDPRAYKQCQWCHTLVRYCVRACLFSVDGPCFGELRGYILETRPYKKEDLKEWLEFTAKLLNVEPKELCENLLKKTSLKAYYE